MSDPCPIPHIRREELTREVRDIIEDRGDITHLWSGDWSPEFYEAQARLGMIAVSAPGPDSPPKGEPDKGEAAAGEECAPGPRHVILPELQKAYAVLDWPNLRMDRSVRRILLSGRREEEPLTLKIDTDPRPVMAELKKYWGSKSWLCPEYQETLLQLAERNAADDVEGRASSFRLWGIRLTAGPNGESAAGELGYTIGRTYTSLTGFHHRRREWNNLGKVQMVLLAQHLEAAGLAFWNLGHPYMEYKRRLGARILFRRDFLDRWEQAIQGSAVDIRL